MRNLIETSRTALLVTRETTFIIQGKFMFLHIIVLVVDVLTCKVLF